MAGIRKVKARAGQIKEITNDEAQKLFKDKAIPVVKVDFIKLAPVAFTENEKYKSINHNYGRVPTVRFIYSTGEQGTPVITHIDENNLEVRWKTDGISGFIYVD